MVYGMAFWPVPVSAYLCGLSKFKCFMKLVPCQLGNAGIGAVRVPAEALISDMAEHFAVKLRVKNTY